jgi:hypothetical protein
MTRSFRSIVLALMVGVLGVSSAASAQTEDDLITLLRDQIKTDRQAVVAANLDLSDTLAEKFWPLYDDFHSRMDVLADRRVELLTRFRDERDGITANQSRELLSEALNIEDDMVSIRIRYVRDFQKAVGPRLALRFYQIESKLNAIINYELASVVPLRQN